MRRPLPVLAAAVAAVALTACGSSSPSSSTTTLPSTGAIRLTMTHAIETQLIAVFAASHHLKASDFTGFTPGSVYLANGRTTGEWAGVSLVAAKGSVPAGIATEDDGSYVLFMRTSTMGPWNVYEVGAVLPHGHCPLAVPAAVLAVWGWPPRSCQPGGA